MVSVNLNRITRGEDEAFVTAWSWDVDLIVKSHQRRLFYRTVKQTIISAERLSGHQPTRCG